MVNTTLTYDRNSNPISASDLVRSDWSTGIHPRDFLYTVDGLNRVTSAERGNLSSGSITNLNWRQEWSSLTLTGNWEKHTIDGNGNGVLTDDVDRSEITTPSVFKDVNEWKNRLSNKTASNKDDATYSYDANGNLTAEVVDIVRASTTTERRHFTYDAFNRLISVHSDAVKTTLISGYLKRHVDPAHECSRNSGNNWL